MTRGFETLGDPPIRYWIERNDAGEIVKQVGADDRALSAPEENWITAAKNLLKDPPPQGGWSADTRDKVLWFMARALLRLMNRS